MSDWTHRLNTPHSALGFVMSLLVKRESSHSACPLIQSAPVGSYLYVQGHLDVEQVLILSQVLGHLTLQVPQLSIQVANSVL